MISFFELQGLELFSRNSGLWERIKRRPGCPRLRYFINRMDIAR